MAKIYRCKRSFAYGGRGVTRVIQEGKVVSADDPMLAGRQDLLSDKSLFEPLDAYIDREVGAVEQATAEPGEKRSVTRPRRTRTAKDGKTAAKSDPADKTPAKDAPASGAAAKESAKEGDK